MRCLACNKELTDYEANRKYSNWSEIKNSEQRYIHLCDECIHLASEGSEEPFDVDDLEVTRSL